MRFTAESAEKRIGLGYAICNESLYGKFYKPLGMGVNNCHVTLRYHNYDVGATGRSPLQAIPAEAGIQAPPSFPLVT